WSTEKSRSSACSGVIASSVAIAIRSAVVSATCPCPVPPRLARRSAAQIGHRSAPFNVGSPHSAQDRIRFGGGFLRPCFSTQTRYFSALCAAACSLQRPPLGVGVPQSGQEPRWGSPQRARSDAQSAQ